MSEGEEKLVIYAHAGAHQSLRPLLLRAIS